MRVATMPMQGWVATPTRRNALKMVFIAPAVFMLGVAVQSKPNYVDYDNMISDKEADIRVTNYVPVVRETEKLFAVESPDRAKAREVASLWITQSGEGKLKSLPSQGVEDTIQAGVKSQIASSARDLSHNLRRWAGEEAAKGQYDIAVKDFVASLRVMQPLRYSDITSVAVIGSHQRRTLQDIKKVWPNLSEEQKATVRPVLDEVAPNQHLFDEVVRTDRRLEAVFKIQSEDIARSLPESKKDSQGKHLDSDLLVKVATGNEKANQKLIDELRG